MDANRTPRGLFALAYGQPKVAVRRTKPSPVPGWLFDAAVVLALLVSAVGYLTA